MKHPRDFYIITQGEMTMPGVVSSKQVAEQSIALIKASNEPGYIHVREVLPLADQIKPTCSEVHTMDSEIITNQAKEIERLRTRIEGMILSFNKHGANIDVGFHVKWLSEVLNK